MASIKIKRYTVRAVGMLQTIIHNKWSKEDRKARQLAAIKLAKMNIEELEKVINETPSKIK